MSFELNQKETFADNVARLARQRLDRVLAVLPGGDDATHDIRKNLKKLRALLRLARAGLGRETFERENAACRDAGRALSAKRDAEVLVQAFEGLRGELAGHVAPETTEAIHRQLLDDVQAARSGPEAAELLRGVRERAAGWPQAARDGWRVPGRGLKAVYRRGRRAMRRAGGAAKEEDFHEWRKQVKLLAAQVQLLRPLRPGKLKKLGKALDGLADGLGKEHDLAVLENRLVELSGSWASPHDLEVIGGVIQAHRRALQTEALEAGGGLYEEGAAEFGRRFKRWWKAWR